MSWSSQIHEQFKDIQIHDPNSPKPMGGFGRGRLAPNSNSSASPSSTQNGISNAKSPGSFSFKLNSNGTNAADSPVPQPQIMKSIFGGGSSTSNTAPSLNTGSTSSASFGSVSATFGSGFANNTPCASFSAANATPATTFGNLAETTSINKASSEEEKIIEDIFDLEDEKPINREEESRLNKLVHDKLVQIKELNINVKNCSRKDLDPTSPLFSLKTFDELRLRKELLQGVANMGFSYPSKIQEATLPVLLADPQLSCGRLTQEHPTNIREYAKPQNIIAQSQSGTGKTAAFVLTMLSRVESSKQYPQCLCLAPTYELALQIGQIVETMGKFCSDIKVAYAVRGARVLARGELVTDHIIIGTPGTALDWCLKYKCFDPKLIRVFVLDEADIMISQQGHQDQSIRIQKTLSDECQRLFFSATYEDDVIDFAGKIVPDPIIYTVRKEELPLDNVKQYYVECSSKEDKFRSLSNLYGGMSIGQSMIFCHTKKVASWLASEMTKDGHSVALLSSELDIVQRAAVIKRFKDAMERCLICTNVCARGIDVQQVTVVVNFDLPVTTNRTPDFETYLHRIGRTGRFGKSGLAINFIDGPRSKSILEQIEKYFDMKIPKLDTTDMDAIERIEQNA